MSNVQPWCDPRGCVLCRYCVWCVYDKDGTAGNCTHTEAGFSGVCLDWAECELGELDPAKWEARENVD